MYEALGTPTTERGDVLLAMHQVNPDQCLSRAQREVERQRKLKIADYSTIRVFNLGTGIMVRKVEFD